MKSLIKEEEQSPFTGFDQIYDKAITHAIEVVRTTYIAGEYSHTSAALITAIESNLLKLKSTNHE